MLSVSNLCKAYSGESALSDVSFNLQRGEIVALLGANGSGKTTLVNIITGIYAPDTGKILFNGVDITGSTADQTTRFGIARTFQNIRIFSRMTVLENVLAALISLNDQSWRILRGYAKSADDPQLKIALKALETVELLNEAGVATLAGTSFGAQGEGYLRFSYANSRDNIMAAIERIKACLSAGT
mgnify:CR=1 FL=1